MKNTENVVNGHPFANHAEAARARELRRLESVGALEAVRFHPTVLLSPARIRYTPEFAYRENGAEVWEDFFSEPDPRFRDVAKLWAVFGPGELRVTGRRRGRFRTLRTITPREGGKRRE